MSLSPIAAFARAHDPDRFLAALFAPPERREAIFTLIAFNHELARAREAASHPMAALIRLQWWRDVLDEAQAGKQARRHEVAAPLHAAITAGSLDPVALGAMIDAREAEAEEAGIPTEVDFVAWLRGTAGGFAYAAGLALGGSVEDAEKLRALGAAYGLAGVLRSVTAHAAQGRCLLPGDRLAAAGLNAEAVINAPMAPVLAAMCTEMAAEGVEALRSAPRDVPKGLVAPALLAVLAARDLRRLVEGKVVAMPRGVADRVAVIWAGWRGRV
ncbi:MAG: squalene/phytoene synthase family protein [Roseomonas sp.]|nr:squalene/phytoene synthase family protein [Roseomonas sp.]